jgi:amino acid transporter
MTDLPVEKAGLSRVLSPRAVVFLTFSGLSPVMSVYLAGDGLLHIAGAGAALSVMVGGVIIALIALLYAEMGAAFPGAGGIYPSLTRVLGPATAFPIILLTVVAAGAATGFTALGFGEYLRVLLPGLPLVPTIFTGLGVAALISILNIRTSAWVTGLFLGVEFAALALLTCVAATHPVRSLGAVLAHPVVLTHGILAPASLTLLGLGLVSGVWVAGGANYALYFAEEMREPRKIGQVIAWVGVLAALFAVTPIVLMLCSARDLKVMLGSEAPIAAYLAATGGHKIAALVSAGVVAALFNSLIATVMIFARFIYATGRDGIWPSPVNRVLDQIHPRLRTPWSATLVVTVLAGATSLMGDRAILILLSGDVSQYILLAFAIWVGRRSGATGRWFRAPLHPAIPAMSLAFGLFALAMDWFDPEAGRPSTVLLSGVFLFGIVYYAVRLRAAGKAWKIGGADSEVALATGAAEAVR